ncbi:MAG: hypothetical protein AMXMBFR33_66610 [Candidatus Xenobia bacterium]
MKLSTWLPDLTSLVRALALAAVVLSLRWVERALDGLDVRLVPRLALAPELLRLELL